MKLRRALSGAVSAAALLLAGAIAAVWLVPDWTRQYRVMATGAGGLLLLACALLWILALSGWRAKHKLFAVAACVLAVGALCASVRIEGVSGDLVPVLSWRWSSPPELEKPGTPRPVAAPAALDPLDYPRFLGSQGDSKVRGVRLARDWSARPPRLVWRRPVGAGWSSFAIAQGRAYTQEGRGEEECINCYDLARGEPVWIHAYPARFETTIGGEGPRATPSVAGGSVFALGATGILSCVDASTGEKRWSRNIVEENGARVPEWGKSCSPLVAGERVLVSAGGKGGRSLVAYHASSGERIWSGGDARSGYASPLLAELAGSAQVVVFNSDSVAGHDLETGRVLWSHPWIKEHPNVAQPVALGGGRLLVSSGYGVGAALLEVERAPDGAFRASELWRQRTLKSKLSNIIERQGRVFGLDDGILVCLRLEDGERAWKGGRYGHGQLLLVEDLLIVQAENGDVALVEASEEGHRELGRVSPLSDKTWNHPAFRPPYLLVRNHKEAVCLELPLLPASGAPR